MPGTNESGAGDPGIVRLGTTIAMETPWYHDILLSLLTPHHVGRFFVANPAFCCCIISLAPKSDSFQRKCDITYKIFHVYLKVRSMKNVSNLVSHHAQGDALNIVIVWVNNYSTWLFPLLLYKDVVEFVYFLRIIRRILRYFYCITIDLNKTHLTLEYIFLEIEILPVLVLD